MNVDLWACVDNGYHDFEPRMPFDLHQEEEICFGFQAELHSLIALLESLQG
jgi:hypothetical protein